MAARKKKRSNARKKAARRRAVATMKGPLTLTAAWFRNHDIGCESGVNEWEKENPDGVRLTRKLLAQWFKKWGSQYLVQGLKPTIRNRIVVPCPACISNGHSRAVARNCGASEPKSDEVVIKAVLAGGLKR
jgi:hypothetical protein